MWFQFFVHHISELICRDLIWCQNCVKLLQIFVRHKTKEGVVDTSKSQNGRSDFLYTWIWISGKKVGQNIQHSTFMAQRPIFLTSKRWRTPATKHELSVMILECFVTFQTDETWQPCNFGGCVLSGRKIPNWIDLFRVQNLVVRTVHLAFF